MQHTVTREDLRNDNHEVRVFLSVVETIHLWFGYCLVLFNLLYYVAPICNTWSWRFNKSSHLSFCVPTQTLEISYTWLHDAGSDRDDCETHSLPQPSGPTSRKDFLWSGWSQGENMSRPLLISAVWITGKEPEDKVRSFTPSASGTW